MVIGYLMRLRRWRLSDSYKWVHDRQAVVSLQEGETHCSVLPLVLHSLHMPFTAWLDQDGSCASTRLSSSEGPSITFAYAQVKQPDYSSLRCSFLVRAPQVSKSRLLSNHQVANTSLSAFPASAV